MQASTGNESDVGISQSKPDPTNIADYKAARRACSNSLPGEEDELCAKLDGALSAGWSIQALKAYAIAVWQQSGSDYVSEVAWRLAIEHADSKGCSGGRDFLSRYKANHD
jgi:hypothetical protein